MLRRIVALVALLTAFAAPAADAAGMRDLAPADEYFGRLKMSVLGIRNELNGLEQRPSNGDRNIGAMSGKLAFVDDAIRGCRATRHSVRASPRSSRWTRAAVRAASPDRRTRWSASSTRFRTAEPARRYTVREG